MVVLVSFKAMWRSVLSRLIQNCSPLKKFSSSETCPKMYMIPECSLHLFNRYNLEEIHNRTGFREVYANYVSLWQLISERC